MEKTMMAKLEVAVAGLRKAANDNAHTLQAVRAMVDGLEARLESMARLAARLANAPALDEKGRAIRRSA